MMYTSIDFFGPESRYDHALQYNKMAWDWPGSALTASTNFLRFDLLEPVQSAIFTAVWWPLSNAYIRVVHMDDGPTNLVGIAELHEANRPPSNPIPTRVDLTQQINDLIAAGVPKHLGYQLHGNLRIGVAKLEVTY